MILYKILYIKLFVLAISISFLSLIIYCSEPYGVGVDVSFEMIDSIKKVSVVAEKYDEDTSYFCLLAPSRISSFEQCHLSRVMTVKNTKIGDLQVGGYPLLQTLQWENEDFSTPQWRPQGICKFKSANGTNFMIVSWYGRQEAANDHKGARITIINSDTKNYVHLLLVQNACNIASDSLLFRLPLASSKRYSQLDGFAPVPVHAGGIVCASPYLFVADTKLGIRVFNLNKIYRTTSFTLSDRCGIDDEGIHGFEFEYIIPEVAYYKISGAAPYSYLFLEEANGRKHLWTGQYLKSGVPFLSRFTIDNSGLIDENKLAEIFVPLDEQGKTIPCAQGFAIYNEICFISRSGAASKNGTTSRLVQFALDERATQTRLWPHGSESLFYNQDQNSVWSLTEFENNRFLFCVKLL